MVCELACELGCELGCDLFCGLGCVGKLLPLSVGPSKRKGAAGPEGEFGCCARAARARVNTCARQHRAPRILGIADKGVPSFSLMDIRLYMHFLRVFARSLVDRYSILPSI